MPSPKDLTGKKFMIGKNLFHVIKQGKSILGGAGDTKKVWICKNLMTGKLEKVFAKNLLRSRELNNE